MASPLEELSVAERESLLALLDGPLFPFDSGDPSMSVHETGTWNTSHNPTASDLLSWMFPNPDLFQLPPHQLLWPPMSTSESLAVASLPQAAAMIGPTSCPGTSPVAALDEQPTTQVTAASPSVATLSPPIHQASQTVPSTMLTTPLPPTEAVIAMNRKGKKRKAEGIDSRMTVKTTAPMLPPTTKKAKKSKENSGVPTIDPMPTSPASKKSKKTNEGKGEVLSDNLRRSARQPKAAPPMAPTCVADPNAPTPGK